MKTLYEGHRTKEAVSMDREFLVTAARDAGFSEAQWRAMFYEKGPYDVTFATFAIQRFAELIVQRSQELLSGGTVKRA